MKKLILLLLLSSNCVFAELVEVHAQKIKAKAGCFTKLNCSTWQGEYECERSGVKLIFDKKTQEAIDYMPSEYSFGSDFNCKEEKTIGSLKNNEASYSIEERVQNKGKIVEVVIFPNKKYYLKNL